MEVVGLMVIIAGSFLSDEVLPEVVKTLGCVNVEVKPPLSMKSEIMSWSSLRASRACLRTSSLESGVDGWVPLGCVRPPPLMSGLGCGLTSGQGSSGRGNASSAVPPLPLPPAA